MYGEELWDIFEELGLTFFSGVPDSTFKAWMTFLDNEHGKKLTNIIACSECEAVAVATGYHLATGKTGVVYLQNAGEGKIVNPLTSLCDPEIYSIPLFLMIGWRGEPGKKDEPQHRKMGKITLPLLEILNVPYKLLSDNFGEAKKTIGELVSLAETERRPVALIVKRGVIKGHKPAISDIPNYEMKREEAIKLIVDNLNGTEVIIATTGKTSRELYEYRLARHETPHDFYTVGGMGCSAAIALGIALQKPNKRVIILDGDGSILMQMGSLATIGHYHPKNLYHILIDNGAHDSTGGQPTVSSTVNFEKIALACGYRHSVTVKTKDAFIENVKELSNREGPLLIVIKVAKGARNDLGRPTTSPLQNKEEFMGFMG